MNLLAAYKRKVLLNIKYSIVQDLVRLTNLKCNYCVVFSRNSYSSRYFADVKGLIQVKSIHLKQEEKKYVKYTFSKTIS